MYCYHCGNKIYNKMEKCIYCQNRIEGINTVLFKNTVADLAKDYSDYECNQSETFEIGNEKIELSRELIVYCKVRKLVSVLQMNVGEELGKFMENRSLKWLVEEIDEKIELLLKTLHMLCSHSCIEMVRSQNVKNTRRATAIIRV